MVCLASLPASLARDADLHDAQQRFESHVLRTSQPILERYRFVGRGSARMMQHVHAAYVAVACLGNPDPVGMKVYCPTGKETFDDEETKEAPPRRDRGEAA